MFPAFRFQPAAPAFTAPIQELDFENIYPYLLLSTFIYPISFLLQAPASSYPRILSRTPRAFLAGNPRLRFLSCQPGQAGTSPCIYGAAAFRRIQKLPPPHQGDFGKAACISS